MSKVIITRGLPASGKSTWSKEFIEKNPGWKRVNKDDLRAMIDNGKWSKENEKTIIDARDALITLFLRSGYNVIVDDTNLNPEHYEHIKDLALMYTSDIEYKDFLDVPLRECIERDLSRSNSVGKKVIMRMYKQFIEPNLPKPVFLSTLPNAIICDLDGTLALMGDRSPYDASTCDQDELNHVVANLVWSAAVRGARIIFCSGREDKYREMTLNWLNKHGFKDYVLLMRTTGDNREDSIIKKELYEKFIKDNYNVLYVFDDRNRVVDMWRANGLTCLQVNFGDF